MTRCGPPPSAPSPNMFEHWGSRRARSPRPTCRAERTDPAPRRCAGMSADYGARMPFSDTEPAWTADLRGRVGELIDEYRASLHGCVDGLSEDEARLRLVPSATTLLGLLKHVTYVEGVWFDQAISGRSYAEIGIASTPSGSFALAKSDTIASVQEAHRRRCEASRAT